MVKISSKNKISQTTQENLQKKAEQKAAQRQKKKHPKMQVSGKSVFKLQRIIIDKKAKN